MAVDETWITNLAKKAVPDGNVLVMGYFKGDAIQLSV